MTIARLDEETGSRPPHPAATSVDKNVVDRRAAHRLTGSRVALASVRNTLLSDDNEPSRFRSELLQLHVGMQAHAKWALLALIIIMAGCIAPLANGIGRIGVVVWFVAAVALWYVLQRAMNQFGDERSQNRPLGPWATRAQMLQAAQGVLWGVFFTFAHPFFTGEWSAHVFASPGVPGPVLVGGLLLVGSAHVLWSHALRGGVAAVCVPPFLMIALLLIPSTLGGDGMAAASLIGAAALVLMFWMLGARLLFYARGNVRARMEKDHATLEAEEAQNLSEEARRRAEEANMAKTRFLATMSHELRTPLNAILGFSEIMEQEAMGPLGNPKYKEYAGDIHGSGAHLLKLINEILDLSRVEAGRYDLHEEAVDLVAIATDAIQMIKLKASAKTIDLQIRAERDLPRVWADERAVRQVVLNLLSNAVKFTPKGGRIVVKVGWTGSGGQYVTVADNGPGIPEEEIPIVLSSFGQGSIALRVAEPGSGLGLPIVQAFMAMHDGRLDLKSRLREGTQAIAVFPRRRVMADELPDAQRKPRQAFVQPGSQAGAQAG